MSLHNAAVAFAATVNHGILGLDRNLTVIFANSAFCEASGLKAEDVVGRPVYNLDRGRWDVTPLRTLLEQALAGGGSAFSIEAALPLGGKGPTMLKAAMMPGEHSDVLVILSVEDASWRRYEETKARLAAIVESADDVVISKDLQGLIMTWNQGAQRIFGYTAEEAIGRPITMLMPPERFNEEPGILDRVRHGESIHHYETVRRRKDGTTVDISLTVSPIIDSGGRIIGASKIARDITDQKRAEKRLKEEDRRKDEFIAMLSHELRNPLAPMRSAIDLLGLYKTRPAPEEVLTVLDRQVTNLTRIVDDLLDITRVRSGKIQLRMTDADLRSVAERSAAAARYKFSERRQTFIVELGDEPLPIRVDPTRIEQVLTNLLTNATKFTPDEGHVRLILERAGSMAVARVTDDGIGIDPETRLYLFELFSQGPASVDRPHGGLGLGLALAKQLVEIHQGSISAASEGPGRGSEFTVRLPLALPAPSAASDRGPGGHQIEELGTRVLVVDDMHDTRAMAGLLLSSQGYVVRTAHDGPSALETALEFKPNVVLLDIGLPLVDGYEVARRMRREPALRDVLLIAVTGYGLEADRQRSREAGFDYHLVKPVDFTFTLPRLLASQSQGRGS